MAPKFRSPQFARCAGEREPPLEPRHPQTSWKMSASSQSKSRWSLQTARWRRMRPQAPWRARGGPQLLAGSTPVFRPSGEYISGGLRALRDRHPEQSHGARHILQGRWSGCRNARFSGVSLHATATSLRPAAAFRWIFIDFPGLVGCPKSNHLRDRSTGKGPKTNGKVAPGAGHASYFIGTVEPHRRPPKRVRNAAVRAREYLTPPMNLRVPLRVCRFAALQVGEQALQQRSNVF